MRYLKNSDALSIQKFEERALELAERSDCSESHYGAVIFKGAEVLGEGYNHVADPFTDEYSCTVDCPRSGADLHNGVGFELCISTHAEEAAINDMLLNWRHSKQESGGAQIIVARIKNGTRIIPRTVEPYCTRCASKIVTETLASDVMMRTEKGIVAFDPKEFFRLSVGNLYRSWKEMLPDKLK